MSLFPLERFEVVTSCQCGPSKAFPSWTATCGHPTGPILEERVSFVDEATGKRIGGPQGFPTVREALEALENFLARGVA
jgi:hypothetical protein